jgi:hypothetical protein
VLPPCPSAALLPTHRRRRGQLGPHWSPGRVLLSGSPCYGVAAGATLLDAWPVLRCSRAASGCWSRRGDVLRMSGRGHGLRMGPVGAGKRGLVGHTRAVSRRYGAGMFSQTTNEREKRGRCAQGPDKRGSRLLNSLVSAQTCSQRNLSRSNASPSGLPCAPVLRVQLALCDAPGTRCGRRAVLKSCIAVPNFFRV